MVVVGDNDSIDIVADSDSTVHMIATMHTKSDIGFDTDWEGNMQADTMLMSVHPEFAPNSSLSMCRLYFPSRVGMLYNPSLHALLTYKIYKTGLLEYLQSFASIDSLHHDFLLSGIGGNRVVLGTQWV